MQRRFVAVVPEGLAENPALIQLMTKLKRTMRERGQNVRWVSPDLWHVTLAFLGNSTGRDTIENVLAEWRPDLGDIELRLHGLGAFPSIEEARVLWIGCQASAPFLRLQAELTETLIGSGFNLDPRREYKPHLTLGRFRNPLHAGSLVSLGGRRHFGDYRPRELILFEGAVQGGIMKYIPRWRKALVSN